VGDILSTVSFLNDSIAAPAWYTKVSGVHPQTGENVEEYGCAVAWIPFLQMDNTMHVNQAGAAIESLRNETVERMSPTIPIQPLPTKPIKINGTDFDNS
jgi:hypothetical protein